MQKRFLSIAALFFVLLSCMRESAQPGAGEPARLTVSTESISATAQGTEDSFKITSNCYWNIAATDPDGKAVTWITLSTAAGQETQDIAVVIKKNTKTVAREAVITITSPASDKLTQSISVTQEAGDESTVEGYTFPIIETLEIDAPNSRKLVGAVIADNECVFPGGMVLARSNPEGTLMFDCPSHTQPSAGDEGDRSIHRSIKMDGFEQGESVLISAPVKMILSGDVRLMMGARAASFTKAGWSYYWSRDGENWNKIGIANAITPGSDAMWNIIPFTIPQDQAIPAGGTFYFKITADQKPSKEYISISNTIALCAAKAPLGNVPAMDADKIAFSTSFDDLTESNAPDVQYPLGLLRSATNSYASNWTSFNSQYIVPDELAPYAGAKGCYEKFGYLQVGYYDESLWTRMCCGTYTIKIGERLKEMNVANADAKLTLKACNMKDFRGYDNLAKVTLAAGEESYVLEGLQDGVFAEFSKEFHNLTQQSEITITTPRLTDAELAELGRGANAKYLQDYRFFIDDLVVELTAIHETGGGEGGEGGEGGGQQAETKTLTFDFSGDPLEGWPDTDNWQDGPGNKTCTYPLEGVDYEFLLTDVGNASKARVAWVKAKGGLVLFATWRYVGLPALEGYKLIQVSGVMCLTKSGTRKAGIVKGVPETNKNEDGSGKDLVTTHEFVTGGESMGWTDNGVTYTFNLTGTEANTRYYYMCTGAGVGVSKLELVYEKTE